MATKRQDRRPAALHLSQLEELPPSMAEHALVPWEVVALLMGHKDVPYVRELVTAAGLPLVQVSTQRKLPRWRDLRAWLESREISGAPQALRTQAA